MRESFTIVILSLSFSLCANEFLMFFPDQLNEKNISILIEKSHMNNQKAFEGAALMMSARYVFSPFMKLSNFINGRNLLEEAIRIEPQNMSYRYIRLLIQIQAPFFLGYRDDIANDLAYIVENIYTSEETNYEKLRMIGFMLDLSEVKEKQRECLIQIRQKLLGYAVRGNHS